MAFGDRIILKLYRALEHGINPDLEIGRFLTARGFGAVPAVCGALEYVAADGSRSVAAIAQQFVANQGDVFTHTLDRSATTSNGRSRKACCRPSNH